MEQFENDSNKISLADFVRQQVRKQAIATFAILLILALVMCFFSVLWSTARHGRNACHDIENASRGLVSSYQDQAFKAYQSKIEKQLLKSHEVGDVDIVSERPSLGIFHYSIGKCSLEWTPDFKANVYFETKYAYDILYIKGTIQPRFIRTDLLYFLVLVSLLLILSHFWSTRPLIRTIKHSVSEPLQVLWESIGKDSKAKDFKFKEFQDLWEAIEDLKELMKLNTQMKLSIDYNHELKDPAYYMLNKLKEITFENNLEEAKRIARIAYSEGEKLVTKMEDTLRRIVKNEIGRNLVEIDLKQVMVEWVSNLEIDFDTKIVGEIDLIQALFKNLYENAFKACPDRSKIETKIYRDQKFVTVEINNPFCSMTVDTDTNEERRSGHGIGIRLSRTIVKLHKGLFDVRQNHEIFKVLISFPIDR